MQICPECAEGYDPDVGSQCEECEDWFCDECTECYDTTSGGFSDYIVLCEPCYKELSGH